MIYELLSTYVIPYAYLYSWRDGIEILFFSLLCYKIALFLKQDRQNNLIRYFFAYLVIFVLTYTLELNTAYQFLYLYSPAIIMLFFMMHQRTLQKNMVGQRAHVEHINLENKWLEQLIQAHLHAINNMQELTSIIENKEPLHGLLQTPLALNTPFTIEAITLIVESTLFKPTHMMWISKLGIVRGINATYTQELQQEFTAHNNNSQASQNRLQDACLFTQMVDAIVVTSDPTTRKFTLIVHGKIISSLTADRACALLERYTSLTEHKYAQKQGVPLHEHKSSFKSTDKQPQP